jgi:hypothetical protein
MEKIIMNNRQLKTQMSDYREQPYTSDRFRPPTVNGQVAQNQVNNRKPIAKFSAKHGSKP